MRLIFVIGLLLVSFFGLAQTKKTRLVNTMKEFHQALVNKDLVKIDRHTHKSLSYGHSNGWIETKTEMIKNLETGYISYSRFREDSIVILMNGSVANLRFIGNISATLQGSTTDYHLKVLEVWVKKGRKWLLFGRQSLSVKK